MTLPEFTKLPMERKDGWGIRWADGSFGTAERLLTSEAWQHVQAVPVTEVYPVYERCHGADQMVSLHKTLEGAEENADRLNKERPSSDGFYVEGSMDLQD